MKLLLAIGSLLLSAQVYAGSLTIQELGTTTETGDFPVCSNGAGKLLPCADDVVIPPPPDGYLGEWTGRMSQDPRSTYESCFDADVTLRVVSASYHGGRISSRVVRLDSGQVDILGGEGSYLTMEGFTQGYMLPFGFSFDYTLQFSARGHAEGIWAERNYDCYGTWTFTRN